MESTTVHIRQLTIAAAMCVLTISLTSPAHAGRTELTSAWRTDSVQIDGNEGEWSNGRYYLDESKLGVGLRNDGEYLYVHFVTTDEATRRQIFMHGLTVWFDPDGGDDKEFGVHYPLGRVGQQGVPPADGERGDPQQLLEMSDTVAPEMELLDAQGEVVQRLLTGAQSDIDARITVVDNRLIYELRVPLYFNDAHPRAIGTMLGAHVGIGFETPEPTFNRETMSGRHGGSGGRGGGMPRRGQGGFGNRPGSNRGDRPQRPEPFKIWLDVGLAAKPDTQSK